LACLREAPPCGAKAGVWNLVIKKEEGLLRLSSSLLQMVPKVWHITNRTHLLKLDKKWFMTCTFKWP
jgi:hypothetical protein